MREMLPCQHIINNCVRVTLLYQKGGEKESERERWRQRESKKERLNVPLLTQCPSFFYSCTKCRGTRFLCQFRHSMDTARLFVTRSLCLWDGSGNSHRHADMLADSFASAPSAFLRLESSVSRNTPKTLRSLWEVRWPYSNPWPNTDPFTPSPPSPLDDDIALSDNVCEAEHRETLWLWNQNSHILHMLRLLVDCSKFGKEVYRVHLLMIVASNVSKQPKNTIELLTEHCEQAIYS